MRLSPSNERGEQDQTDRYRTEHFAIYDEADLPINITLRCVEAFDSDRSGSCKTG